MSDSVPPGPGASPDVTAQTRAQRRLAAEKGFYVHLAAYAIVIGFLFVLNAMTGTKWWFVWPAFGWGIGILIHGLVTFGVVGFLGQDWEERRLRELVEEERARQKSSQP